MELPCGNSCMRLAQRNDGRDGRGEPEGDQVWPLTCGPRRTGRLEPEFLRNRQGVQLPHCMGSRGQVSEGHASEHTASWWPSLAGHLSSQLAFPMSLSSAQSCLPRVGNAPRRGHGACPARWRFQHRPALSLLIFPIKTLSPLLMNSLSLCPCGNFHQLAPRRCVCVCVCVCVCARARARTCLCTESAGALGVLADPVLCAKLWTALGSPTCLRPVC